MSGSAEFIGAEQRPVNPKDLIQELKLANLIDEAAAITTVCVAARRDKHPDDNLIPVIKNLRGDLYSGQHHLAEPHLRQLGEAEAAMVQLEEGYIALRAAHARRLHSYAEQANQFLESYPGSVMFQDDEGGWTPITRVAVLEPDRWHRDRELIALADDGDGDGPLALLRDQILCNRAALGVDIENQLANQD